MTTHLEFLNSMGNESIAGDIQKYDGPVPMTGDIVYQDAESFQVIKRVFYYVAVAAGHEGSFRREMKVSLRCESVRER